MKKIIKVKPFASELYELAKKIVLYIRSKGKKAFIVGGSVRDMILGTEPKEYDIATSAVPDEVCKYFSNTVSVGASFGVIIVVES